MLESSAGLIHAARSLAVNLKDLPQWLVLASHSHTVSDSIKKLITNMRDKALGHRECDKAIKLLNRCMREVDQASLTAISQLPKKISPRRWVRDMLLQAQLGWMSLPWLSAVYSDPNSTAASHNALFFNLIEPYFEPFIIAAIGTASKTPNHQQQMNLLNQTKALEVGRNPKQAVHTQEALKEVTQMMKEAVEDLTTTLNVAASAAGVVGGMVDSITQAINQLNEEPMGEPEGTLVDYQTTVVKMAKAIAVTVQEMVTKSTTNPDDSGILANQLTNDYGQLVQEAKPAALTTENKEVLIYTLVAAQGPPNQFLQ
uniref:Uncharacterized protein n=1 Tax=Falco tinnunculus TaxID=100819 RepID=A0A8C4XPJ1_FALTI